MSPLKLVHNEPPLSEAEQAIVAATALLPQLCSHGMMPTRDNRCDGFDIDGVSRALAFLKKCGKKAKADRSSYSLKHEAENWCRRFCKNCNCYCSNGELIAAAAFLGFPIKYPGDGPNVLIGAQVPEEARMN